VIVFDLGWVLVILAWIFACAVIVAAVVVVPCMWREGGYCDRRRSRRT
jgi:hypothetical protein